jgi:hypothetical protein
MAAHNDGRRRCRQEPHCFAKATPAGKAIGTLGISREFTAMKLSAAGIREKCLTIAVNEVLTCSAAFFASVAIQMPTIQVPVLGISMRSVFAALTFAAALLGTASAHAEKKIFIIANNADGYGVDRCLASGGNCGTAVANSYCRAREFAHALSFRKVDRDDITGAIPTTGPGACRGGSCDDFVAIECSR